MRIVRILFIGLALFAFSLIANSFAEETNSHGQEITHNAQEAENGHVESENQGQHGNDLGQKLPLWSIIPFIGILLSIALFPLFAPHFWHHHFPKLSAMWALLFAVPFLIAFKSVAFYEIMHIYMIDYIPFIILLWGLFTVSGGILLEGSMKGSPVVNTIILLIGTVIASWVGTTGAAMLLVRPLLRANDQRQKKTHTVVFFIFLVCNIGGSLTPLGDPPLFLGFLHKVPFFWTLKLIAPMSFVSLILLGVYFAIDSFLYAKDPYKNEKLDPANAVKFKISGYHNVLFLAGIVAAVLMSGMLKLGQLNILGVHIELQNTLRDFLIIMMGVFSMITTKKLIREKNGFTWFPILEVAYLFAGIFMTIIPALAILKAGSEGSLAFIIEAVKQPYHYFWVTGILSSFLDNAPTYLTFFNTALGSFFAGMPEPSAVAALIKEQEIYLMAISCGAVFMGANTYIGNAPNFMVKSIAEEAGIIMPSFFGYMFKYSIPVLIPVFILVTFVFF
ncbi:MAG: sodium:proton antiporter [Pseudomonadota bacterium]